VLVCCQGAAGQHSKADMPVVLCVMEYLITVCLSASPLRMRAQAIPELEAVKLIVCAVVDLPCSVGPCGHLVWGVSTSRWTHTVSQRLSPGVWHLPFCAHFDPAFVLVIGTRSCAGEQQFAGLSLPGPRMHSCAVVAQGLCLGLCCLPCVPLMVVCAGVCGQAARYGVNVGAASAFPGQLAPQAYSCAMLAP
jgi:hypothetical protein